MLCRRPRFRGGLGSVRGAAPIRPGRVANPRPAADPENQMARIYDNQGWSLTSRSQAARGRASRPRAARRCTEMHKTCTPGFARRGGLGSFGAGDWVRSARGLARIGRRAARGRTEVDETCTLGFARRGGLASVGAGDRVRPADRPAARRPIPGRRRTHSPGPSTEQGPDRTASGTPEFKVPDAASSGPPGMPPLRRLRFILIVKIIGIC